MICSRRKWLKKSMLLTALTASGLYAYGAKQRIMIGACDWSLGKSCDPAAFDIAKMIGLEGVQVNLGNSENNLRLRQPEIRNEIVAASKRTGIPISSLAIAELNRVPYKSESKTEQWVSDAIDVAASCGAKVILLAFFEKGDLRNDPKGISEVVKRLKAIAPKAEKHGVNLGIESYLSAPELISIMDQVGSDNIKVYYDFRNSADAGYDVVKELHLLGKTRICELHMKENGVLLGKGSLDWKRICDTLDAMDYIGNGWAQIEWAMPDNADVISSYKHNLEFLKQQFGY